MHLSTSFLFAAGIAAASLFTCGRAAAQAPDFKKEIAPMLEASCIKCHNETKAKAKLNMATKEGFLKGGEDGKIIDTAKPDESMIIKALLLPPDHEEAMPPEDKAPRLTAPQIATLKKWIAAGAPWPDGVTLKAPEEAK